MIAQIPITTLMFADDICVPVISWNQIGYALQILQTWESLSGIGPNFSKTRIMAFSTAAPDKYRFGNWDISITNEHAYLGIGISFESRIIFQPHLDAILGRARRAQGLILQRLRVLCITDPKIAYNLFKTYVLGSVGYAFPIWGPFLTKTQWHQLEKVQTQFFRQILCLPGHTLLGILYAEMGALPLEFYLWRQSM